MTGVRLGSLSVAVSLLIAATSAAASPAFLWADGLKGQQGTHRTDYQAVPFSRVAAAVSNLSSPGGSELWQLPSADLVAIFAGSEVSLQQLATGQAAGVGDLLHSGLQHSSAAVSLPYVQAQEAGWEQLVRPAQGGLWVGGSCGQGLASQPLAQLPGALASGSARTLLLCVADCAAAGCLKDALAAVQQHAQRAGLSQAYAYLPTLPAQEAAEAQPAADVSSQRRRLQASAGSTVLCNAKCQSQVKLYEAIILAVTLLSALFTGLICMHVLGTPDKWEKPKEAQRQE